jgi:hypothetical protein
MHEEIVAAKVTDAAAYEDLMTGGFASGYTFKCHACDVAYRLFYRSFGGDPSVDERAADVTSFESCVENSHPTHPDRIWVKRLF